MHFHVLNHSCFLVFLGDVYVLFTMMMSLLCYDFLEKFYTDAYSGCLPVEFVVVLLLYGTAGFMV